MLKQLVRTLSVAELVPEAGRGRFEVEVKSGQIWDINWSVLFLYKTAYHQKKNTPKVGGVGNCQSFPPFLRNVFHYWQHFSLALCAVVTQWWISEPSQRKLQDAAGRPAWANQDRKTGASRQVKELAYLWQQGCMLPPDTEPSPDTVQVLKYYLAVDRNTHTHV